MAIKIRPSPAIPDHEVLRKIGGGAYGEVWLARGVTGALRAVKVVWREDFEDSRGFEREFEGVLKYEPMSRDHPALVNILHVGRSPDNVSFYYYVMELGDDVATGQDINPIEYEPRTLRPDNHQGPGVQWDINTCIDVGLRLAEALGHLHEKGLAHRDVKPSNVIFVNGRAKLADIGLVAARGQRTFVGTEGFVPPEGPGSTQADVYSLGKVLYEIATGKDRMLFPEVPDEIPLGPDRKRWLEMNKIICDICEPRISKRKISSAADLADALRLLQRGKKRRQTGLAVMATTAMLVSFAGWGAWQILAETEWIKGLDPIIRPVPVQTGLLRVLSAPDGAEVTDGNGKLLGVTNGVQLSVTVGDDYFFTMKRAGYRTMTLQGKVPATVVTEPLALFASLENFTPPQIGEKWNDHLGNSYQPAGDQHISSGFVTKLTWDEFTERGNHSSTAVEFFQFSQNGRPDELVLATETEANVFCKWFQAGGLNAGFLTEDHEVVPVMESSFENPGLSERALRDRLRPFRVMVRLINYGEITLSTSPPGVEVWMNALNDPTNRISVGSTRQPLVIPNLKPADWQLYLVCEGYKPLTIDIKVGDGEKISKQVILEKSLGVVFGKPWENSAGMRFVPLGQDLMISIWETRVRDYQSYLSVTGPEKHRAAFFAQKPDEPVVNVSRQDGQEFCKWLTEKEREDERIAQTHLYRLPTDLEWSRMVGLDEPEGFSPNWRDARKQVLYPWGTAWPPTPQSGNFADMTAARTPGVSIDRTIWDYDDGFAFTAPVGSFPPNSLGIFDLSGNVQEWVEDEFSKLGDNPLGVLRGGTWNSFQSESLCSGSRNAAPPNYQDAINGFRVVLAKLPADGE